MLPITQQYERWPYPRIPLFARLHRDQLWQVNVDWIASTCGLGASKKPKIWIAGCGTFQPYVFSRANPGGKILATDISQNSLRIAQRRCRWHGIKNVSFDTIDLNDETQYPNETFDYIECYGVLMNLKRPDLALKWLRQRLAPNGVLRIMVYPHYGRQRVLQIQRLAKLLGLSADANHPRVLKAVIRSLPLSHPLRFTFDGYPDSKNSEGIVDGFLHSSQRAFAGIELAQLVQQAKLKANYYFHRPWGQPREMAEKLGLLDHDPALWLHYLDLWQNLQTNFTLCLTHRQSSSHPKALAHHPLFDIGNEEVGWRHRGRLLRLGLTGASLQSRTTDRSIKLSASKLRDVLVGDFEDETFTPTPVPVSEMVRTTSVLIEPNLHFLPRLGEAPVNPLYAHLFDAFVFDRQWNHLLGKPLPPLEEQLRRWEGSARTLENTSIPWGLTPYGTLRNQPILVQRLIDNFLSTPTGNFSEARLDREPEKLRELGSFLAAQKELPRNCWQESELRELWVLLLSYRELFLRFH